MDGVLKVTKANTDGVSVLPQCVKEHLFSFLDFRSLGRAAKVCTQWRRGAQPMLNKIVPLRPLLKEFACPVPLIPAAIDWEYCPHLPHDYHPDLSAVFEVPFPANGKAIFEVKRDLGGQTVWVRHPGKKRFAKLRGANIKEDHEVRLTRDEQGIPLLLEIGSEKELYCCYRFSDKDTSAPPSIKEQYHRAKRNLNRVLYPPPRRGRRLFE